MRRMPAYPLGGAVHRSGGVQGTSLSRQPIPQHGNLDERPPSDFQCRDGFVGEGGEEVGLGDADHCGGLRDRDGKALDLGCRLGSQRQVVFGHFRSPQHSVEAEETVAVLVFVKTGGFYKILPLARRRT